MPDFHLVRVLASCHYPACGRLFRNRWNMSKEGRREGLRIRLQNAAVALFVLAFLSCGPRARYLRYVSDPMVLETWSWYITDVPVVWGFTCDFPSEYKGDVRGSFEWWDDMTAVDLFHERRCVDESVWPERQMIVVAWSKEDAHSTGFGTRGTAYRDVRSVDDRHLHSAKIRFWRKWFEDDRKYRLTVARHEIGHALGFHHIPYKDRLMYRHTRAADGLKNLCDVEEEEFRSHYGPTAVPVRRPR